MGQWGALMSKPSTALPELWEGPLVIFAIAVSQIAGTMPRLGMPAPLPMVPVSGHESATVVETAARCLRGPLRTLTVAVGPR
jgi:hypothetical protein